MREILFRGKNEYSGEWVCGSLHIEYGETDINGNRNIDYRILGMHGECDYVIPESVGQFTGMTDMYGNKIFEGDILKSVMWWCEAPKNGIVTFKDGAFGFIWLRGEIEMFHAFTSVCNVEYEVIGNIHDNPELLKGENNG